MRRRGLIKTLLILAALFALSVVIVGMLLKQEPDFYVREKKDGPRPDDSAQAGKVVTRLNELMEDVRMTQKGDWGATFTADELNAFFRDGESGTNPLTAALLGDLPDPRVSIDDDRLRIAFREGNDFWSAIILLELRMWLVEGQSNLVAMEIVRFQAGAMPLPKNWVLDDIGHAARRLSADVNWYRNGENPVAICKLYANQHRPETQVTTLRIGDGCLAIGGRHTGQPAEANAGK